MSGCLQCRHPVPRVNGSGKRTIRVSRPVVEYDRVTSTPEGKPRGWIWLFFILPPGGVFLWMDWVGAHAPGWVNLLVVVGGLSATAWLTYRLQWPNGYQNRRRHVSKHRSGNGA